MDETDKFVREQVQRMNRWLVKLGYAEKILWDVNGVATVILTERGDLLKAEVQRIYQTVVKDKGEAGESDAMSIFVFMALAPP